MKLQKKISVFRGFALLLSILSASLCFGGCSYTVERDHSTDGTLPVFNDQTDTQQQADTRPRVAITFDDGPHVTRTKAIVDELNKYGYHATFFVVGNRVDGTEYNGGEAMKYALDAGNEIAIHGYTHTIYYDECSKEEFEDELNLTYNAIQSVCPNTPIKLMRPIGGSINDANADASPYAIITWDVDSEDWMYKYKKGDTDEMCADKVNTIVENVLSTVSDGSIILLHDIHESSYDATVIILKQLYEMGYNVVTVSELLGDAQPGTIYTNGRS